MSRQLDMLFDFFLKYYIFEFKSHIRFPIKVSYNIYLFFYVEIFAN